jgi:hypothetical protein
MTCQLIKNFILSITLFTLYIIQSIYNQVVDYDEMPS